MPSRPHRRPRRAALAVLALLLAGLPALTVEATSALAAGPDLVVNGSFEDPPLAQGTISEPASIPGWDAVGACPLEVQNGTVRDAYDGAQIVELNSECQTTMQQVVPVTAGALYTLTYEMSARPYYLGHARVAVDGVDIADPVLDGTSGTPAWTPFSSQVRATGPTMTLTFQGLDQGTLGMLLDDVQLTAVPLPYDPATVAQNTSWPNAAALPEATPTAGTLSAPGEARWFRFPVTPGSSVRIDLTGLSSDADLTLFTDIGAAFTAITTPDDLAKIDTEATGNVYSPSVYSPSVYSPSVYSPSVYSPSVYSPSVYSPSVYSPSVYSPSVYSPSVYSPSVYSPSVYSPSVYSPSVYSPDPAFLQAFSSAQTRSIIGGSAQPGTADESVSAATWSASGSFYVRVQAKDTSAPTGFSVRLTTTGGPCSGLVLDNGSGTPLPTTPGAPTTVVLTDTARLHLTGTAKTAYLASLGSLAARTSGVVVDAAGVARTQLLNAQADAHPQCAYAENLVAQSLRDVVNGYRAGGALTYVVIAGGDDVVPFFRYADAAGLGPESDYVPPVIDSSAAQGSLRGNTVLGQDAYGTLADVTVKGGVLPVPDLAVGRLVETPADITSAVTRYLASPTLTAPKSSLVTGYDFLTRAADSVQADLSASLPAGARTDTLITNQGVPTTTTTVGGVPDRNHSWTATDLRTALTSAHHDVVLLAGHFNSASTLAADYATSVTTADAAASPGLFAGSLVISPGCHAGYNLLDSAAVPGVTPTLDWAQLIAEQGGTLVAGSGYQYADTDFLEYSAKLYAQFVTQLRTGSPGTPVALGKALVAAKQAYLADVGSLTGIDSKSLLEATLYGLPMTGIDFPVGRTGVPAVPAPTSAAPVTTGPGAVLGLQSTSLQLTPVTTPQSRAVLDLTGAPTGASYRWLTGPAGVQTGPALPALPEQVNDVTSDDSAALRGVGFRGGTYTDTPGTTPLTGAPTTEQNGIHTSFGSTSFFPHRLTSINSFGRLAGTGDDRTRLLLTPAQYRADPGATTSTERRYSAVGLSLFYSSNTTSYGGHTPALAAPPSVSGVTAVASGGALALSAHITGDPTAGIQSVWMTYTAESGPWHGAWQSVDLLQDATDSTLWTAQLPLGGQDPTAVRLVVQAVNGVGGVAYDDASGDGYVPTIASATPPPPPAITTTLITTAATSAAYGGTLPVTVAVTGVPPGSVVTVGLGSASTTGTTGAGGTVTVPLRLLVPVGSYPLRATYGGDATHAPSTSPTRTVQVVRAPTRLVPSVLVATVHSTGDATRTFMLTSNGAPLLSKAIVLSFVDSRGRLVLRAVRTTDGLGRVNLGLTLPVGQFGVLAAFSVPAAGSAADPSYAPAAAGMLITVQK